MYDAQALYNMQNDPNLLLQQQQQQYLNQLYLNGYFNPYYQAYIQLCSQLQNMTPDQQQQFLMLMGYQNVSQTNENNNNGNSNTPNNGNQNP